MTSSKRLLHFKECLELVQGNMNTPIPDNIIIDRILPKLKGITHVDKVQVKTVMKELQLHKYYEYIPYITNKINGVSNIQFSPDLEAKLCSMFVQIQDPFETYCKKQGRRVSFPNYIYIIQAFLTLLGEKHDISQFLLRASQEKLNVQNEIFQFICEQLGWSQTTLAHPV